MRKISTFITSLSLVVGMAWLSGQATSTSDLPNCTTPMPNYGSIPRGFRCR